MNTKRYTLSDAHSTQFYQLPKWLVALRVEAEISNEAILLYTYLRDRVQLSITNKWIDDNGEAYLYFKREQMEKLLGCKKDKVQKIIKELKSVNLLDEVRQGLNQPNRLYLRYPDNSELIEMSIDFENEDEEDCEQEPENPEKASDYAECGKTALRSTEIPQSGLLKNRTPDCGKSEVKSAEISQSRVLKNRSLDFCKTAPNKTEYNKTEYNKTDSQSDGNFDFLMNADVPEDFAKACISLICEITTTPLSTVRIGKQVLPSTQVCQALHSLTPEHLQAVYRITKYSNNVRKPKGYLLALLYNAAQAAPESNLYAQFFAMPPEEHKPSFDIKLYEKYDIFDYLNEERSPEHET
jgi:replication initiator protein